MTNPLSSDDSTFQIGRPGMTAVDVIATHLPLTYQRPCTSASTHMQKPLSVLCPLVTSTHRNLGTLSFSRDRLWNTHCLRETTIDGISGVSRDHRLIVSPITVFMIFRLASIHELGSLSPPNPAFGTLGLAQLEDALGKLQYYVVLLFQQLSSLLHQGWIISDLSETRKSWSA